MHEEPWPPIPPAEMTWPYPTVEYPTQQEAARMILRQIAALIDQAKPYGLWFEWSPALDRVEFWTVRPSERVAGLEQGADGRWSAVDDD